MITPKPKPVPTTPPLPASRKSAANALSLSTPPSTPRTPTPTSVFAGGSAGARAVPRPAPGPAFRLRPLKRVERIALFEREVRERPSRAALELVFRKAEVISEGQRAHRDGRPTYFGSTMLTLDLEALAPSLREACDAGTARRLATLLANDPSVGSRVKTIATREAIRLAGGRLRTIATEVKVSARGARIFIDVDVEGTP